MNLLEKYIRLLLTEGRVDDVKKKYPNYSDSVIKWLTDNDPSEGNKYIMWMANMLQTDTSGDDTLKAVGEFHKLKNRLPKDKRDLYLYKTVKELQDELSKAPDFSKRQQKKIVKREGVDVVFENDEAIVVIPKTHKASCYYGSNTKWCTAWKNNSSHFEKYLGEVTLYYILPKDGGEKVAVAVGENGDKEIFDYKNGGKSLNWLEDKLQQYNIPSSIFKYIPFTGMIERSDGTKMWYINGRKHREDGPAYEGSDGSKYWYLYGKHHRTGGPAIERSDGSKFWSINGLLHRTDGPAIERSDGSKEWWLNGERHRTNGPAYEGSDGTKEWWLNGSEYLEDNYWEKTGLDKKEEYYNNLKKSK
jgi:hypothetical protein